MLTNKTIHYCWFGGEQLSKSAKQAIESWKKYAPDYEIKCWNESNITFDECEFATDAYACGKYAFVSDYVRFKVIYLYGGIYMDVGSELICPIDKISDLAPFSSFELKTLTVNPGLVLSANSLDPIVAEVLSYYKKLHFENTPQYLDKHIVNNVFTGILQQYTLKCNNHTQTIHGWTILNSEYFNPKYGFGGYRINENTISIHRYSASWGSAVLKEKARIEYILTPFLGVRLSQIVARIIAEFRANANSVALKHIARKIIQVSKGKHGENYEN